MSLAAGISSAEAKQLSNYELALAHVKDDLALYAQTCLKILGKAGGDNVPFVFNKAQRYIHARLEAQREVLGYVRALILKGRQQGCSTYVAARFYHKASITHGQGAFIVAHEAKATTNLFRMVKRYHDHNPISPSTSASNAQELLFDQLDSGYKLATAGSKDVGRSNTARLFHGSEFGFWDNAQTHLAGVGETIPSGALGGGTEMILESTANGLGNAFHSMWQSAEAGVDEEGNPTEYIAIFVPWYWQDEYRTPPVAGFKLSLKDEKYRAAYGLDLEQMQWRANKIAGYGKGFSWLFDQEYPATAALAFKTSTMNPLISPEDVTLAVNSTYLDLSQPLIIGVDPAGDGVGRADRTAFAFRCGRTCFQVEYHNKLNTMQIAGRLAKFWLEGVSIAGQLLFPEAMFIDKGGLGVGIVDRLDELNIPCIGVMFGESATEPDIYLNRRAEMWWLMKDWFEDAPNRIPNDAQLVSDVCAPQPVDNSTGKKQLESKKQMTKRQIRSPDGGDALALTFAHPVKASLGQQGRGRSNGPATAAGY
jgi:hypothetical protein